MATLIEKQLRKNSTLHNFDFKMVSVNIGEHVHHGNHGRRAWKCHSGQWQFCVCSSGSVVRYACACITYVSKISVIFYALFYSFLCTLTSITLDNAFVTEIWGECVMGIWEKKSRLSSCTALDLKCKCINLKICMQWYLFGGYLLII